MPQLKFRTEIECRPNPISATTINHTSSIILLGSCFSDNIGHMLSNRLFCTSANPVGILFNPFSIARSLEAIVSGAYPTSIDELEMTADNGMFHSLDFHGSFSSINPEKVLASAKEAILQSREFLQHASVLVITLGSNHVYIHRRRGHVVANCHRLPTSDFIEKTLSVDECREAISRAFTAARSLNPAIKLILTVSPVRHTAYTLHGNTLSKAALHLAINDLIEENPADIDYFPAYEIMVDDLRDYRFYADDLKHPSELAVKYIYDQFEARYMDRATVEFALKCNMLTSRLAHRPMTDAANAVKRFNDETLKIAEALMKSAPEPTRSLIHQIISQLK